MDIHYLPYYRQHLTDDMERRLLLQAIETQFRPHPLRALGKALRQFINHVGLIARSMTNARSHSIQTQAL